MREILRTMRGWMGRGWLQSLQKCGAGGNVVAVVVAVGMLPLAGDDEDGDAAGPAEVGRLLESAAAAGVATAVAAAVHTIQAELNKQPASLPQQASLVDIYECMASLPLSTDR